MYKCLVTKLKESVDNTSLPYFGEIIFSVNSSLTPGGQNLRFETEGVTLVIPDGYTRPDSTHLAAGVYQVKAYSKYDMTKLIISQGTTYSLSDLQYCTNLTNLSLYTTGTTGDISLLSNLTNLTNLVLSVQGLTGSISSLSTLVNILGIDMIVPAITGNINSVATMTKCTLFNFTGASGLTGNLEEFCTTLLGNGKTSETFSFRGNGSTITFNSIVIPTNSYRYVRFLNGVITVATYGDFTGVLGTYDGTSWSYN